MKHLLIIMKVPSVSPKAGYVPHPPLLRTGLCLPSQIGAPGHSVMPPTSVWNLNTEL